MHKRFPLVLRHITYNLRGGFLLRPLAIALALGLTGAAASWVEEVWPVFGSWVPSIFFPSRADPLIAQVILSDIATSIMTVVSIVFAILLMTLTLASMQFSPRILISFSRDRVTQRTLGIFLGTFCYCIAALPAARTTPRPFAPVATVTGAMALALACVGCLLYFIHHISHAISVNFIVDRIAAETEEVIGQVMSLPLISLPRAAPQLPRDVSPQLDAVILNDVSGYIRFVDVDRLLALAIKHDVQAKALRRVGHFVPAGVPLLTVSLPGVPLPGVSRDQHLPIGTSEEFRGAFDIGPSRTLQQDVEFGVLQIVDIALRAISPAVNDPSTAINCIDQLSRIIIRFAASQQPASVLRDSLGKVRLTIPWIDFEGLLDTAFDQIWNYGLADAAVCLRLLRGLGDISIACPDLEIRRIIADRAKRGVENAIHRTPQNAERLHARLNSISP